MPQLTNGVGFQGTDTSRAAAEHLGEMGRLSYLRQMVKDLYAGHPDGLTADECAELMGESVLAVRPRVTELKNDAFIVDTGTRRKNRSGRAAAVLRWDPFVTPKTPTEVTF